MKPSEALQIGCEILSPTMTACGFKFVGRSEAKSSGGPFASGKYVNGDRTLELHSRFSLGLVTYHFGSLELDHVSYMRELLGVAGANKYPRFADAPVDQFKALAFDLEHYSSAFMNADRSEFEKYVRSAEKWHHLSGFARLDKSEG